MATAPGVFVQLQSNEQSNGVDPGLPTSFMGFQCLPNEGFCIPVQARATYDANFPLFQTQEQCQMQCTSTYSRRFIGDLDISTGPKKAPKSFSE
jgi:hypothetical protein